MINNEIKYEVVIIIVITNIYINVNMRNEIS